MSLPITETTPQGPLDDDNNSAAVAAVAKAIVMTADDDDEQQQQQDGTPKNVKSVIGRAIQIMKYVYSFSLLVFSVTMVMYAMFTKQTVATADNNMGVHPALAFVLFWFLLVWLATMEGGQGALVGLQPVDQTLYADTHPRTVQNTKLVHTGDNNMERFIVGRQFLVVLVVFSLNMIGTANITNDDNDANDDASAIFNNLPDVWSEIFLESGLAMILITVMIGQLTAQVNAASCMLDFLNNYFMLFTTYVSLGIETSGILHSVYLVQIMFSKITGTQKIETKEPLRSTLQHLLFWSRVLLSLGLLAFAFAVTLTALFQGKTSMWEGVPEAVSVILFFVLMCFVGMMEGMQIALFAVVNLPLDELAKHTMAAKTCDLTFTGRNLEAFLIGRQICVTICMFVVARITTITVDTQEGDSTIFGVSESIQKFFNTGLLGALITTIVASLAWRIVASSFPVAFLSNPLVYLIIRLCLILEASGICSAAWLLAWLHKTICNFQRDEVFIGTPEERANKKMMTMTTNTTTNTDHSLSLQENNNNNHEDSIA